MQDLTSIIDSLLFVAEEPLTVDKLAGVLEGLEKKEIRAALEDLRQTYQKREGGFYLCEVAGGWQLRSRPEYHEWIKRMLQPSPQRLSKAALETLAIVAYKQPVIRADIEYIRGVDSGGVLRQLMERKLIRVLGRKEIPGRPLIYATTKLFLELFDLKDLKDLPSPKEIEELAGPLQASSGSEATADDTRVDTYEVQEPPPDGDSGPAEDDDEMEVASPDTDLNGVPDGSADTEGEAPETVSDAAAGETPSADQDGNESDAPPSAEDGAPPKNS